MCGIFGVFNHLEAANIAYLGLHYLQHRGQESAGIVSSDGNILYSYCDNGHVHDVFKPNKIKKLLGNSAIGHVRYSTSGDNNNRNIQPISINHSKGAIAIAHNGNIVNAKELKEKLEITGSIFQGNSDTEVILHKIVSSNKLKLEDRILDTLMLIKGAYSIVFLTQNKLIAVRDPMGFRPLFLGKLLNNNTLSFIVASEGSSFDIIGAELIREINPGEMISIDDNGVSSIYPFDSQSKKLCIFEFIYFSRPDSIINNLSTYEVRKNLGKQLAIENKINADMVIPVPDSGFPAAMGYAKQSNLQFEIGLIRSHYVGRTFIAPKQSIRNFGVRLKFNVIANLIRNKRIIIVDDSIVRGTTIKHIINMLKEAGAAEIHVCISSPPVCYSCYYGIDTSTRNELIAANSSIEEIKSYIGATSLSYLTKEGMFNSLGVFETDNTGYCDACFTGKYPIECNECVKFDEGKSKILYFQD